MLRYTLLIVAISAIFQQASGACSAGSTTTCSKTSPYSNDVDHTSLTYDGSTGKFSGSLATNLCPDLNFYVYSGVQKNLQLTGTCTTITFNLSAGVAALRNRIAVTLSGGISIYGPMDAGFVKGQACSNSPAAGECDAGTDVGICINSLTYQCGSGFTASMFLDDCGAHASPYHYHADVKCTKSTTTAITTAYTGAAVTGAHSPMTAISFDGYGIYGLYESGSTIPSNLDACGGHTGPVPTTSFKLMDGSTRTLTTSATTVYHYHFQTVAPYTLGCYGPVASVAACKALYTQCSSTAVNYCTSSGSISYVKDCPCFVGYNSATQTTDNFNNCYSTAVVTDKYSSTSCSGSITTGALAGNTYGQSTVKTCCGYACSTTSSPTPSSPTPSSTISPTPSPTPSNSTSTKTASSFSLTSVLNGNFRIMLALTILFVCISLMHM